MVKAFTKEGIARTRPATVSDANVLRALLSGIATEMAGHNTPIRIGDHELRLAHLWIGWAVYTLDACMPATYYTDVALKVVVINPQTWRTLSFSTKAQGDLLNAAREGASGMKFLVMDSGPYGEAARLEAARQDVGQPEATQDRLAILAEKANRLIVKASNTQGVNRLQTQLFMADWAKLQEELAAVQVEILRIEELIDLAGRSVVEATS